MTATFPPALAAAVEEVDRLVRPWLVKGDDWRKDADGLPLPDDMAVALARLRGQQRPDLSLELHFTARGRVYANERDDRVQYEGATIAEALLRMLQDDLRRTCETCREYDSHDVRCPALVGGDDQVLVGEERRRRAWASEERS